MTIKQFLKLVEIQTKVASVIPFFAGCLYAYYRYDVIKLLPLCLFLICLLCIDMATTTINNYLDYKRAIKKHGYNYEEHNAIVQYNLTEGQVIGTIITLLVIGAAFGLLLFINTDIIILLFGILAFGIGILYSFGPIPISRTPLGELFSGLTMGGLIFFVTIYAQVYDLGIINLYLDDWTLGLQMNLLEIIVILFVAIPFVSFIANIMLANNICDLEDDVENKRYTLPYYIGKKRAVLLFVALNMLSYVAVLLAVVLQVLPLMSLVVLLTLPINIRNTRKFYKTQIKAQTFVTAVQNFMVFGLIFVVGLGLDILLQNII